jgi:hypothetical protein
MTKFSSSLLFLYLVFVGRSPAQEKKYEKSLKDSMGKLFLWGDGFRDGRLETTLEKSDDLKEATLENLTAIGKTLISCKLLLRSSTCLC